MIILYCKVRVYDKYLTFCFLNIYTIIEGVVFMKLTKKLLLLQFSVMLIFIFSACNYESGVLKTLPKYSGCEKYSYGARVRSKRFCGLS